MARFARYTLAACLLLTVSGLGCATRSGLMLTYPHAKGTPLAQSSDEHYQSVSRIAAHDRRALVEDLDLLFMTDRPTRLTRWHSP